MRPRSMAFQAVASAVVLMLTLTCETPQTVLPTAPNGPLTSRVEIVGPDAVAPGSTAQFSAVVYLTDGTTKIATAETLVRWQRSSSIVDIDANGVVLAKSVGDVTITVDVPSRGRATKEVVVVPEGTYRLVGTVTDAEIPQLRVPGARVEVTPGGAVATTGADGAYRLYGVPADADVTVTAPGYLATERAVHLQGHAVEHFALAPAGPRSDVHGVYTLNIDFDGNCSQLPVELRHRQYLATLIQQGFQLDVVLSGAEFRIDTSGRGNRFAGTIAGNTVRFELNGIFLYYYFYYVLGRPDLAELLPDGTLLVPIGVASATLESDGSLRGTLAGSLTQWAPRGNTFSYRAGCFSSNIRFTLTPR